jgi:NADP-dependent aldehyde dehydrogenase
MLHGMNLIAGRRSGAGPATIAAHDPRTGERLMPAFCEATGREIGEAARAAEAAVPALVAAGRERRARLLECIAAAIESLGDELVQRVMRETGLPETRIVGERGRTTGQIRMFAELVREGSWVDARIDRALPDRQPFPKPDIRRMLAALGPVAVFGASNFPLAFSVAGGDTASALAAGCPVVCKAHPAHPGTSELVAEAIARAVEEEGFPAGIFSLVHGSDPPVSLALASHPAMKAVAFTGSLRAGRALFDVAAARPDPIPVFAEMGSVNPVFVLPGAARERGESIAAGLVASVTLGSGQFCTNPGLVFGIAGPDLEAFAGHVRDRVASTSPQILLHRGIRDGFEAGIGRWTGTDGVRMLGSAGEPEATAAVTVQPVVFVTDARTFTGHPHLHEEVFGPVSLLVEARGADELHAAASTLEGNLTATIHGTERDLEEFAGLVELLSRKVGRLIVDGFPTGVEVCPSMHHGGPWPATTDARSTSVGTAAIFRFARPICYQNFPESALPPELRNANPAGIWRTVDGHLTRDAL